MMSSTNNMCMKITIRMEHNGTNPVITLISTDGLMTTKTPLLDLGMEVTSLSYNGQSAYLAGENLTRKNGGKHPFFAKQSVMVPGTGVIAVAINKAPEDNTDPFLIRGVVVGSQSSWRGSQLVEVLVYSIAGMKDDNIDEGVPEREGDSASEGSSSDYHDEDAVCSSETVDESPCCDRQNVLKPDSHNFSWGAGPPPSGVPCGGYWSTQKYIGRHTIVASLVGCFLLGFVGPMVLCCPLDERNVYIVNGKVYAACGKCIALED
jgi:hypothetical protein